MRGLGNEFQIIIGCSLSSQHPFSLSLLCKYKQPTLFSLHFTPGLCMASKSGGEALEKFLMPMFCPPEADVIGLDMVQTLDSLKHHQMILMCRQVCESLPLAHDMSLSE